MSKLTTNRPLVDASYQELVSFVRYFGYFGTPVIIGGWAVFFYNPYFGSVDIDVVGPSLNGAFDEIIEGYERSHGYNINKQDLLGTEMIASKPICSDDGKKIGDMEIDACSYEQPAVGEFHEDKSKILPYALCERDGCKAEVSIANGCICYVPSKPLLTLFKVKARRDRSYDITTKGPTMGSSKLEWLRSKVTKDGSDIIGLLDPAVRPAMLNEEMNYQQMRALASESKLTALVTETLQNVLVDEHALSLYGHQVNSRAILKHLASVNM